MSHKSNMTPIEQLTIVAIRIVGLLSALLGMGMGIVIAIQSYDQMDLTYIDLFLRSRLASPIILLITGILLLSFSRKIARWLLHGLPLD